MSEARPEGLPPSEAADIRETAVDSPEVAHLLTDFRDEMRARYRGLDTTAGQAEPVAPEGLGPPDGRFLGLYAGGELVACGGVRVLEPGVAEIKRMYVVRDSRGQGCGRKILAALEDTARALGCNRVRLDTGEQQPEARALYLDTGYRPIPSYNDMPAGTFWAEKQL